MEPVKKFRQNLRMTQTEFGALINVTPQMVCLVEKGNRAFSQSVYNALAKILAHRLGREPRDILAELVGLETPQESK